MREIKLCQLKGFLQPNETIEIKRALNKKDTNRKIEIQNILIDDLENEYDIYDEVITDFGCNISGSRKFVVLKYKGD